MSRWVAAQDLFDTYSQAEDDIAFARAGGRANDFDLVPPARLDARTDDAEASDVDVDEFLEDDAIDELTTAALRAMTADVTDTLTVVDDETTGTLPALA